MTLETGAGALEAVTPALSRLYLALRQRTVSTEVPCNTCAAGRGLPWLVTMNRRSPTPDSRTATPDSKVNPDLRVTGVRDLQPRAVEINRLFIVTFFFSVIS